VVSSLDILTTHAKQGVTLSGTKVMHQILHESALPLDNPLSQLLGNCKDLRMFQEELEETWKKQGLSSFQLSAQTVSNTKRTRLRRLAVLMVTDDGETVEP
jgi:hypothetical protein